MTDLVIMGAILLACLGVCALGYSLWIALHDKNKAEQEDAKNREVIQKQRDVRVDPTSAPASFMRQWEK